MNLKSKKVRSDHVTYLLQATLWHILALSEGVLQLMQACDSLHKLCVQVEIKTTSKTVDVGHLQKAADFVHAFILGKHGNSALICHLLSAALHSLFGNSVQGAVYNSRSLSDTWFRKALSKCGAGFEVADAIALLRLDDLYIESFEIKDVKVIACEHHH